MDDSSQHNNSAGLPLWTQNLSIGYKNRGSVRHNVAENLNLELQPGKLTALIGPNGTGKSTLIRTLAGLQQPLAGMVALYDKPVADYSSQERARKLSIVLTRSAVPGPLTVRDLVSIGRTPYSGLSGKMTDCDREVVEEAIQQMELESLAERDLHQLSDGENQKVMIARALAQSTPVMLLDEPTAHLDAPNRVEVIQLLHELAHAQKTGEEQEDKSILFSTHEVELALKTADEIWVMDRNGDLIQGIPEKLAMDGTINRIFGRERFVFDDQTGSFELRRSQGATIQLIGEDTKLLFWTKRALERTGFFVSALKSRRGDAGVTQSEQRKMTQVAVYKSHSPEHLGRWVIQGKSGARNLQTCHSLLALLQELRST